MSAVLEGTDRTAVLVGAAATLGVCVPIAILGSVVLDDDSSFFFLLAPFTLVAFLLGGAVAGHHRPSSPPSAGAIAAALGFGVAQVLSTVLRGIADEGTIAVGPLLFVFVVAIVLGAAGGRFGARRAAA